MKTLIIMGLVLILCTALVCVLVAQAPHHNAITAQHSLLTHIGRAAILRFG